MGGSNQKSKSMPNSDNKAIKDLQGLVDQADLIIDNLRAARETPPTFQELKKLNIKVKAWDRTVVVKMQSDRKGTQKLSKTENRYSEIDSGLANFTKEEAKNTGIFSKRRRIATNLTDLVRDREEVIIHRLAYFLEFGDRGQAFERLSSEFTENLIGLFPEHSIQIDRGGKNSQKYWRRLFDIVQEGRSDGQNPFLKMKREMLRNPMRMRIEIYASQLSKNDYFAIRDEVERIKRETQASILNLVGTDITRIFNGWSNSAPDYDYNDHSLSFEKLKDYVVEIITCLERLPSEIERLYAEGVSQSTKKPSPEKLSEYEQISDYCRQLKKDDPRMLKKHIWDRAETKFGCSTAKIRKALSYYPIK